MPKSKQEKKEILDTIKEKLSQSKSVIFSTDKGLDVKTLESIRNELKENNAEYLVAKKTLIQMATKDLDEKAVDDLTGSVALTFSYGDEVTGAKIINKFAKGNEALELGGGVLEGVYILPEKVNVLANLPSREELLAKLVGSMAAPMSGMVGVLSGVQRNFVGVLSAIKDQKE